MKTLKKILQALKNKSNIDYKYYHLFDNKILNLDYNNNGFAINYIIYVINSKFLVFYDFYKQTLNTPITDVFLERLNLSDDEKKKLFSMKFKNLFWLKLNNIFFEKQDYKWLINFISNNSLDINRIFLENLDLEEDFFNLFENLKWFKNLSFLNFDNNKIWDLWLENIINFIEKNNINLEYFSLINTKITNLEVLFKYLNNSEIRILDISSNKIKNNSEIIDFIENNKNIRELYIRNIKFSDEDLENIFSIFKNRQTKIYNLRLSLQENKKELFIRFKDLWEEFKVNFDINYFIEETIYSTIYIKETGDIDLSKIENDYFYIINSKTRNKDFKNILKEKKVFEKLNQSFSIWF